MRITSGFARGILLDSPRGKSTRPATDAARQAIFSSLGGIVEGAPVIDMFAGTGAYGVEAASRGAASVLFFENDRNALGALRTNLERVKKAVTSAGGGFSAKILPCDCLKISVPPEGKHFDIIFADPPYSMLLTPDTLSKILGIFGRLDGGGTIFALEAPAEFDLSTATSPAGCEFEIIKRLGKSSIGKPSQIIFRIKKI